LRFYNDFIALVLSRSAQNQSTWLDTTKNSALTKGESMQQAEYNKLLQDRHGFTHQECIKKKIAIRPKSIGYSAKHYDSCWYTTKSDS
jgi:hypothetical protein